VEKYKDFARSVAMRLTRTLNLPSTMHDELESAGMLGLVEAAERFDPKRGKDFRAFAYLRVRGAIVDAIRACCPMSAKAYRIVKALEAAESMRETGLGSEVTPNLGHAIDYLLKSAVAYKLTAARGSLIEGETTLYTQDPERLLARKQTSQQLNAFIATLPEKERMIIEQYYFRDLKLVEVANEHAGLSKSWVSRIHDRALEMLRDKLLKTQEYKSRQAA